MTQQFTVDKAQLIATLISNRENHKAAYQTAMEKYREKAIDEFNRRIDRIKCGGDVETYWRLPCPEEHTDDYTTMIEVLGWHQGDTVDLSLQEFAQYVQDQWGWAKTFAQNTTSYLVN